MLLLVVVVVVVVVLVVVEEEEEVRAGSFISILFGFITGGHPWRSKRTQRIVQINKKSDDLAIRRLFAFFGLRGC